MTDFFEFKPFEDEQAAGMGHVFVKSWSIGGPSDSPSGAGTSAPAWPVKWSGPSEKSVTHDPAFEAWAAQHMTLPDPGDVFG
ncbi:MAG: hypothetical protein AAGC92_02350 [Pseudomonadota bacterium]